MTLEQKHIGCLFTILPHAYGQVTLTCGDESFDIGYTSVVMHPMRCVIIGDGGRAHNFIALGLAPEWSYTGVIEHFQGGSD